MTDALPRRLLSAALLVAGLLACWQALFAYAGTNALTSPAETFAYAAPYIFTGVKLAVAYSFIGVIGAELIMSRTGLGYEIGYAYNNFDNAVMYPLIVFVLAVAATVNTMFFLWEKKMLARRRK